MNKNFQQLVGEWLISCFGEEIAYDKKERNHRFLEEALELVQSLDCSREEAHTLVDYVYNREKGEAFQECGGTGVTFAALCFANELDMQGNLELELARISDPEVKEKIRIKQANKPKNSPLPQKEKLIPHPNGADEDGGYWFGGDYFPSI